MEDVVCKKFCTYYKPKKKRLKCGTYCFLERNLSAGEIRSIADQTPKDLDFSEDGKIKELVCSKCDFLADGCDFRQGVKASPCGGYQIIEHLLKAVHV